jgi:hypothetical protein
MEVTTDRVADMVKEGLKKAGIEPSTQLAGHCPFRHAGCALRYVYLSALYCI